MVRLVTFLDDVTAEKSNRTDNIVDIGILDQCLDMEN